MSRPAAAAPVRLESSFSKRPTSRPWLPEPTPARRIPCCSSADSVKPDDEMKQKMENDAAALMRSVVSRRGRNVEVAESAVRESKSFTEQEALSQHLIDYVASSEDDLFRQIEGKSFKRFNGQEVTLKLSGQPIVPFGMTLKEQILDYLMDPNIAFILLAIGALALYAEFNHPGAVVPGTVGVVFILIAAFALNLLPTRFAALGLILGAFALFAAEAKFASHGVLTIGGITLLTLGGLLLVDSPIPEMRVHLLTALAVSIPLGVITAFLMSIALKARRNKMVSGAQGLIGETGIAQTALSPRGKIFVHGELWDAVSSCRRVCRPVRGSAPESMDCCFKSNRWPSTRNRACTSYSLTCRAHQRKQPPASEFRALAAHCVTIRLGALVRFKRGGIKWKSSVLGFVTIVVIIVVLYVLSSIKILAEYERGVIFRLGRLLPAAKGPGVAFWCLLRSTAWCGFRCARKLSKFRRRTSSPATTLRSK